MQHYPFQSCRQNMTDLQNLNRLHDRLSPQVKWTVSNDEGADVAKWWVAKVIGPSTLVEEDAEVGREADPLSHPESHSQDKKDAPVMLDEVPLDLTHQFAVKYERGGEGFEEEEEAGVAFLSDRELLSLNETGLD